MAAGCRSLGTGLCGVNGELVAGSTDKQVSGFLHLERLRSDTSVRSIFDMILSCDL